MKKIILTAIAIVVYYGAFAQGVRFETGTFADALAKAKKEKRLMFVDVFTTNCGPCVIANTKILPTEEAGAFFNPNFINIKVNMLEGEGPAIAKKYNVQAVPTFLVLDENGVEINRFVGVASDVQGFIKKSRKAMSPDGSLAQLEAAYRAQKSFATGLPYLKELYQHVMPAEGEVIHEIYWMASDAEKFEPVFFRMLSRNSRWGDPVFTDILLNKSKASELLGDEVINSYFKNSAWGWYTTHKDADAAELECVVGLLCALGIPASELTYYKTLILTAKGDIDGLIRYHNENLMPPMLTYGDALIDAYGRASESQKAEIRKYFDAMISRTSAQSQIYKNMTERLK